MRSPPRRLSSTGLARRACGSTPIRTSPRWSPSATGNPSPQPAIPGPPIPASWSSCCATPLRARGEGRAFARRQRAIRALDALRSGEAPPPPRQPRCPRGTRLPRLQQPFSRVIRFEGLPRWAWWRPDPLDQAPKRRRTRRRGIPPETEGRLEALVAAALLPTRPLVQDLRETKPTDSVPPRPEPLAHDVRETKPPEATSRDRSCADATRSVQLPLCHPSIRSGQKPAAPPRP